MTHARHAAAPRIAIAIEGEGPGAELAHTLQARGFSTGIAVDLEDALATPVGAIAFAPAEPPTGARAAACAAACARAAEARQPVVALAAFAPASGRMAAERAAGLALLAAHGAVVCPDPNTWLEALALIARFGLPAGPRVAVVAPPGSWLALSATALAAERAASGARPAPLHQAADELEATDVALVDRSELGPGAPDRVAGALVVPVVGRAESLLEGADVALVGLRDALDAAYAAGLAAERIAAGLGPAAADDPDAPEADDERFNRQAAQLGARAGDHETKVLLAAYGVRVVRQAVATTPSAATRLAKRAGWPVEVKPWSADTPTEPEGCPVERDLHNAPDVRRACVAVAKAAGLPAGAPVIVRETPPSGRELRAVVRRMAGIGWTVLVEVAGVAGPLAAPAPLRAIDAQRIAVRVEATRASDPTPDREALAELLIRASHMAVAREDVIEELELARVMVAARGDGALVVDARATLRER